MSTKQNNCSVFRVHRNTNTRQITALTPILSERKKYALSVPAESALYGATPRNESSGFLRRLRSFCGNYAVLPNGCLAPLVFGLSGSLRGIPSHRARQIFEGLTAHTVGEKDFL